MEYEIFKAVHFIAMVSWFAGLFYLPRLFVYHVQNLENKQTYDTFLTMERKLYYYIMNPAMMVLWLCGGAMLWLNDGLLSEPWMHMKLTLVLLLTVYHVTLKKLYIAFKNNCNSRSEKFFRIYNEVPTIILIIVILLAVIRPLQ